MLWDYKTAVLSNFYDIFSCVSFNEKFPEMNFYKHFNSSIFVHEVEREFMLCFCGLSTHFHHSLLLFPLPTTSFFNYNFYFYEKTKSGTKLSLSIHDDAIIMIFFSLFTVQNFFCENFHCWNNWKCKFLGQSAVEKMFIKLDQVHERFFFVEKFNSI